MRITTRGRYALRACLALVELGKNGDPISVTALAEAENISQVFLEQIFHKLGKAGIIRSVRGPGGGFRFAHPLEKLTVKQILDAAGEDLDITECDKHNACDRTADCLCHKVWKGLDKITKDYFSGITVASLMEKGNPQHYAKAP